MPSINSSLCFYLWDYLEVNGLYALNPHFYKTHVNKKTAVLIANSIYTLPTLFSRKWKKVSLSLLLLTRGESRSEAAAVLFGGLLQVLSPAVTMPTYVRRSLSCGPKETWWGPVIISTSLWSPVNRPAGSRSHKGQNNGKKHTHKTEAHIKGKRPLFRPRNKEEKEDWGGKYCSRFIPKNIAHNPSF